MRLCIHHCIYRHAILHHFTSNFAWALKEPVINQSFDTQHPAQSLMDIALALLPQMTNYEGAAARWVCLAFLIRCVLKSINGGHGGMTYHLQVQSGALVKTGAGLWGEAPSTWHLYASSHALKHQDELWFSALVLNEPRNVLCRKMFWKQLAICLFIQLFVFLSSVLLNKDQSIYNYVIFITCFQLFICHVLMKIIH